MFLRNILWVENEFESRSVPEERIVQNVKHILIGAIKSPNKKTAHKDGLFVNHLC
jgi:hypothetical protein